MLENTTIGFEVECHMTYQQELTLGDPCVITMQLLAYNRAGIHQFNRMYHAERRYLAATAESMKLHVDLADRKVVPWPEHILQAIDRLTTSQGDLPYPSEAGRRINIRNPVFSARSTNTKQDEA